MVGTRGLRKSTWAHGAVVALMVAGSAVTGAQPANAATSVVAAYEMNGSLGSSVLVDSGPNGLHGTIGGDIDAGVTVEGATGLRWPYASPTAPPAKPGRIAYVPTSTALNPDSGDYAVEFRYRTTRSFGNVVQKGQNQNPGGYFKFEQPHGNMTCLFKGSNGQQRAIKSPYQTNDGDWHVIRCERSSWGIKLYTDGVLVGQLKGPTGTISNTSPLSIGGKSYCDQIDITCDYFTGDIDYVRIEKSDGVVAGPNQKPHASFTTSCAGLTCTFDGTGSSDSDGNIVQYKWKFGDGAILYGPSAAHTYASAGTRTAILKVIDDDGAVDREWGSVTVDDDGPAGIAHVADSTESGWSRSPSAVLPAVQTGDTILLFATATSPVSMSDPTGGGWQSLATESGSKGVLRIWQKSASAADSGDAVSVTLSSGAKYNLSAVAYRGVDGVSDVEATVQTTYSSSRVTPTASVTVAGSQAVSYWMHRDSATTSLTPPSGVVTRVALGMSGGGRPTVLIADSGAGTGGYGGLTAAGSAPSTFGITATVILRPD